jgi:hypothetical protein
MRKSALVLSLFFLVGCGGTGGNPASPTQSPSTMGVPFSMVLQTNGIGVSFRVTLNGQTYTTNGIFSQQLPPGVYTLSGSFTPTDINVGEGLIVVFQRSLAALVSGGVASGSLRSLSGPAVTTGLCSVGYLLTSASTTPHTFQRQFEVTTNSINSCQSGA